MENLIETQAIEVLGNVVVAGIKSVARSNKRFAGIINKTIEFDKRVKEHNEFLDAIIAVIKPALHLAHEILAQFIPGYMHVVDLVCEFSEKIYAGVVA